jgi:glycyl-tRNA synthetase beta subunit
MIKDALLEIGSEELPAAYIEPALFQLLESIKKSLEQNQLEQRRFYVCCR